MDELSEGIKALPLTEALAQCQCLLHWRPLAGHCANAGLELSLGMSYRHPRVPNFSRLPDWVAWVILALIAMNIGVHCN